jgi:hypothetical protein
MHLTEDRLHVIAINARSGLRESLKMIELHARDNQHAFLNPVIALTAVATWERFIVDICVASEKPDWNIESSGWDRGYDCTVPWPGSRADRNRKGKKHEHHVDETLIKNDVIASPLTSSWALHIATSWFGADPTDWLWADYSALPPSENRDIIQAAMLGAKSARDVAGHRLYYKKAREAQGFRTQGKPDEEADQRDWCYVWQSDNTEKAGLARRAPDNRYPGRPTIQHGYVRGAVALFIQLVDITVAKIRHDQCWTAKNSQLPAEWFRDTISAGPCTGMQLWGGRELLR